MPSFSHDDHEWPPDAEPVGLWQDGQVGHRLHGEKWTEIVRHRYRANGYGQVGFAQSGDEQHRSSSHNEWRFCQFLLQPTALDCIGWVIGDGGDDHCLSRVVDCEVADNPPGAFGSPEWRTYVAEHGHTGVELRQGNTLDITVERLTATGIYCLVRALSGGAASQFLGCGGTGLVVGFHLDSGREFAIRGGRFEHSGPVVVSGMPSGGQGLASLLIESVVSHASAGGVAMQLGRGGNVSIRGCALDGVIELNHNGSGRQVVIEEACYPKPIYRVVRGDWRIRRDGVLITPPTR